MKLETRIVEYSDSNTKNCLKIIDNFLYTVTINQFIRVLVEGSCVECMVVGIDDSVYDDAIYRYINVFIIK